MTPPAASAGSPACRACCTTGLEDVYRVHQVPVHSCVLLDDPATARNYPRGHLTLAYCPACGLLQNTSFDETLLDYSVDYEDSQAYSQRWVTWAKGIAASLIERHGLRGRHALEVGCGKGDFLALLAEVGEMTGTGFDPAFRPGPLVSAVSERLRFVPDLYSARHLDQQADLVCCRHTLEHVADVRGLVDTLGRGAAGRPGAITFIEVPDATRILRQQAFWDLYFEHCSYFTAGSLTQLFASCGFDVLEVATEFDEQYLLMEAAPHAGRSEAPSAGLHRQKPPREQEREIVAALVAAFRDQVPTRVASLRSKLDALAEAGCNVVLWGAGSKAVSYLTTLNVGDEVSGVVDVNPLKHGKYVPGTGHRVLSPEELPSHRPDAVVLMNSMYAAEVVELLDGLSVPAELHTIDHLPTLQP